MDVSLHPATGFIDHDIALTDLDVDLTPVVGSRFDLIGLYAKQVTQEFTATADGVHGLERPQSGWNPYEVWRTRVKQSSSETPEHEPDPFH